MIGVQRIRLVTKNIDRRADRDVALHRRIDGNDSDLQRVAQIRVVTETAIENRLAVFGFADLQKRAIARRVDTVALRINQMHLRLRSPAIWPPTMRLILKSKPSASSAARSRFSTSALSFRCNARFRKASAGSADLARSGSLRGQKQIVIDATRASPA